MVAAPLPTATKPPSRVVASASKTMPTLKEMLEAVAAADLSAAPSVRVAVLGNVTTDVLAPYLQYQGMRAGLRVEIAQGGYDTLAQEALAERSELLAAAKVVLVLLNGRTAAPDLFLGYASLDAERVSATSGALLDRVATIARGIRRQTPALIVWCGLETPLEPAFGVTDASMPHGQVQCIARLNSGIRDVLHEIGNAYLLDVDRLVAVRGAADFYDERLWALARVPYAAAGLATLAEAATRFWRALAGRARKCLVLDCDDVLWGGVLGEEGLSRIKLSRTHPGEAYRNIQQVAVNLFHRGVAIALCSKNNEADVWEVFDRHPDMVLRREHIAAHRINWKDKASNLVELARELNIGADSLVFVDDNPFEIEMVRAMLPEVETIHVPAERITSAAETLARSGLFDTLSLTEEDKQRGRMFLEAAERRREQAVAADPEAYLASLGVTIVVERAQPVHYARMAQLSQKTNQFNLTTRRYSEGDIRGFAESPDSAALCCTVSDRFGSLGLVGICLLKFSPEETEIDTLLMSCRALGRGAENAMMHAVHSMAKVRGAARLTSLWIPTAKNAPAKDYLPALGFRESQSTEAGTAYARDVAVQLPVLPSYLSVSFSL